MTEGRAATRRAFRFVRALVAAGTAVRDGEHYLVRRHKAAHGAGRQGSAPSAGRVPGLPVVDIRRLAADGVLELEADRCRPTDAARFWLKRQLAGDGDHAAQHRRTRSTPLAPKVNDLEGVLGRLARPSGRDATAFLSAHHLAAARHVAELVRHAQMLPRVTMSYDPARIRSPGSGGTLPFNPAESAGDASRKLQDCLGSLPPECAGVVLDVCGFHKGLQQVEFERQWPRRSAKLILRVGLGLVADHFGLSCETTPRSGARSRSWKDQGARAGFVRQ